jgi:hypothetical protein
MKTLRLILAGLLLITAPFGLQADNNPTFKKSSKKGYDNAYELTMLKRDLRSLLNQRRFRKAERVKQDILWIMKDDIRDLRNQINRLEDRLDNRGHHHHDHYRRNRNHRGGNRGNLRNRINRLKRELRTKRNIKNEFKRLDMCYHGDRHRSVQLVNRFIRTQNGNYNYQYGQGGCNTGHHPW